MYFNSIILPILFCKGIGNVRQLVGSGAVVLFGYLVIEGNGPQSFQSCGGIKAVYLCLYLFRRIRLHRLHSLAFNDLFGRQPLFHRSYECLNINGLGDEVVHTHFGKKTSGLFHCIRRKSDYDRLFLPPLRGSYPAGGVHSVGSGHHMVHEHYVVVILEYLFNGLLTAAGSIYPGI